MHEVSAEELRKKAHELVKHGKKWHFHTFAPGCKLNEHKDYAFILEDTSTGEDYVHHSQQKLVNLENELAHFRRVKEEKEKYKDEKITSVEMAIILDRAKDLNDQKKPWHYHLLFPDCVFNDHAGEWMILFEDPASPEIEEVFSEEEPKHDHHRIEELSLQQKH